MNEMKKLWCIKTIKSLHTELVKVTEGEEPNFKISHLLLLNDLNELLQGKYKYN